MFAATREGVLPQLDAPLREGNVRIVRAAPVGRQEGDANFGGQVTRQIVLLVE